MTDTLDSTHAEAAVLGAAMLDAKAAQTAVGGLVDADFDRDAHRIVFSAIRRLVNGDRQADATSVTELLARENTLEQVGGPVALHDLTVQVAAPSSQRHYVSAVQDWSRRRQTIAASRRIAQAALDTSKPLTVDLEAEYGTVRPSGRRLSVFRDDELDHLPDVRWLVDGMIQDAGLNLMFGAWKQGKSFVALDLALTLLSGDQWHGRKTEPVSSVVYVAAEGAHGMAARRQAWRNLHRKHPKGLTLVASPLSLTDHRDVGELDGLVGEVSAGMLVIDTWARCIGGDENEQKVAGDAVRALDRIRDRHGCSVLVVHHSGHGDPSRTRGASALPAAADSQVQVSMSSDRVWVKPSFVKEAKTGDPLSLKLRQSGPSAALVDDDGKGQRSDEELKEQVRTILRGRPASVVELDAAVGGRHDVVESVLEENQVRMLDPSEVPARWRLVEV